MPDEEICGLLVRDNVERLCRLVKCCIAWSEMPGQLLRSRKCSFVSVERCLTPSSLMDGHWKSMRLLRFVRCAT